ncbi:hypothetical protein [Streptomyces sp. KL116D]|uniref:hypothetical protein n=1 Tax=Streptomyces sp. KL116D TaxID=3045152 RepID=UPI003555ED74
MFIAELNLPDFASYDLSSLRTGIMAGSPCPVEVMKAGRRRDAHGGGLHLLRHDRDVPGLPPDPPRRRPGRRTGTVGRVLPHIEVKVVDPVTGGHAAARRGPASCAPAATA